MRLETKDVPTCVGRRVVVEIGGGGLHFNSIGQITDCWKDGDKCFIKIEVRRTVEDRGVQALASEPLKIKVFSLRRFNRRCKTLPAAKSP